MPDDETPMIRPPAMTPAEVATWPGLAPAVRITCYQHQRTLYVGDEVPDGGAEAVAAAAGCPRWRPLQPGEVTHDPADYAGCPAAAGLAAAPAAEQARVAPTGRPS